MYTKLCNIREHILTIKQRYDTREAWIILQFANEFKSTEVRRMMIVTGKFAKWYDNKCKEWDNTHDNSL